MLGCGDETVLLSNSGGSTLIVTGEVTGNFIKDGMSFTELVLALEDEYGVNRRFFPRGVSLAFSSSGDFPRLETF